METPSEPLDSRLTGPSWVQYLLQGCVQFAHAERSPDSRNLGGRVGCPR
jgi:hypothetical protein